MAQAKGAAGDGDVVVQGAYTAQRALKAGVLDELQIHQIPVLLGGGRRLFNVLLFTRPPRRCVLGSRYTVSCINVPLGPSGRKVSNLDA